MASAMLSSALAGAAGAGLTLSPASSKPIRSPGGLICRAESSNNVNGASCSDDNHQSGLSRRNALALLAGVALAGGKVSTASAAYGESANIFASPKQQSGFTTFTGDGFKVEVPSKWNPSKESEYPGTVLRYEDNFDQKSNLAVMVTPTDKKSITDYGSPEEFLAANNYLLGKQAYSGKTVSEGGFNPNAVASASLLQSKVKEINGKQYYDLDILTRTADGDEGGTHQLIVATVDSGKLYLLKVQAGDKRWFKGAQKFVKGSADSFSLA